METVVQTLDETRLVAGRVVDKLRKVEYGGERAVVLTLSGPLGVGKTAFVKCLAAALRVSADVTSPSFVLRSDYGTDDTIFRHLVHIDAYRMENPSEIETVGWNDVLRMPHTLVVVEWSERISDYIPKDAYTVSVRFHGASRIFATNLLTAPV